MKKLEPKLCPDCPLPLWIQNEIDRRLTERQYTKQKEQPSNLRICMERRRKLAEMGLSCPYYPRTENLTLWQQKAKP